MVAYTNFQIIEKKKSEPLSYILNLTLNIFDLHDRFHIKLQKNKHWNINSPFKVTIEFH